MKLAKKVLLVSASLGTIALIATQSVHGATVSGSLTVSATVANTCSVNSPTLDFAAYNPAGAAKDATATITVTCTNGTTYSVGLDAGQGTGATVAARKMMSGANLLNYALYSDSNRSTNWGNVSGEWVTGTGNGSAQNLTVYGRIPTGQYVIPATDYSDTVAITVTYP